MKDRIATYRDFVGELKVIYKRTAKETTQIKSSKDAEDFLRPYFDEIMDNHEEFKILHLNRANTVCNVHHLSKGGQAGTVADVKLAIREALQICCTSIIICHNHPSSTLKPSVADQEITKRFKKAFSYCDIKLLDSIIITRESYYSMADNSEHPFCDE